MTVRDVAAEKVAGAEPDSGYELISSTEIFSGNVIALTADEVRMPDGEVRVRDVVHHPGAVGILALDDQDRVLVLRQYRHPARRHLTEIPAGLLDIADEPASVAAARELAEEAGLRADTWDVLVDAWASPGGSDETYRIFLARNVSAAPDDGFERIDEEADLQPHWVPLAEAADRVLAGDITNALCIVGILAASKAHADGFRGLRPATAPWPEHPTHQG